jgi:hypothetical protein
MPTPPKTLSAALAADLRGRIRLRARSLGWLAGALVFLCTAWVCLIVSLVGWLAPRWGLPLAGLAVTLGLAGLAGVCILLSRKTGKDRQLAQRRSAQTVSAAVSAALRALPETPRPRMLLACGIVLGLGLWPVLFQRRADRKE